MLRLEWKTPESRDFELIPREAMRFKMPVERRIQDGVKEVAPRLKEKVDVGPSPQGPHNVLTAEQASKGWQLLFDGTQASPWWRGFKKRGLPAGWVVENGMLVRAQGGGDIITRSQFDDFDFYVDWMVAPGGNSGIFFNGLEDGNAIYETAPEMQILDNLRHSDGATALQSAGSNYALHAPQMDSSRVAGEWNRVRIRVVQPVLFPPTQFVHLSPGVPRSRVFPSPGALVAPPRDRRQFHHDGPLRQPDL